MAWTYSCPKCQSVVNPDETVILVCGRGDWKFLIGLHPQPGNYTVYMPPGAELESGLRYDFYCPVCRKSLVSDEHHNLCSLIIWQGDTRRRVLFSRIAGERATYVVMDKSLEERHGADSVNYDKTLPHFRIADTPSGPRIVTK